MSVGGSALEGSATMVLLRQLLGDVLRRLRLRQGRTLREVSASARVSLGYLSEVERGQKEASSELLAAICGALGTPLSQVFREVSDNFALAELQHESGAGHAAGAGPAGAGRGGPRPAAPPDFVSIAPSIRAPKRAWSSRTPNRASAPPPGTCATSRTWCPSKQLRISYRHRGRLTKAGSAGSRGASDPGARVLRQVTDHVGQASRTISASVTVSRTARSLARSAIHTC